MKGSYSVGERVERFSVTSSGHLGVDDRGDVVEVNGPKVRLVLDGWEVRGAVSGGQCVWVRDGVEHAADAAFFTGDSPAFDVALAERLALEVGASQRVALVAVTGPVAAALTVRRQWTRVEGPEPDVDRYEVADLDTGERWQVHLSSGVLVSRDGPSPAHLLTLTT